MSRVLQCPFEARPQVLDAPDAGEVAPRLLDGVLIELAINGERARRTPFGDDVVEVHLQPVGAYRGELRQRLVESDSLTVQGTVGHTRKASHDAGMI